jgi:hypothetical protein
MPIAITAPNLRGPLSLPAIANKALTALSAAAKPRRPLRPLNLSTLRLFIQQEAPFSVHYRSCCPVSSRDGPSSAAQIRSHAVISHHFGHRFRSLLDFIAASASNSVHCGRRRPGNGRVRHVRYEKAAAGVELLIKRGRIGFLTAHISGRDSSADFGPRPAGVRPSTFLALPVASLPATSVFQWPRAPYPGQFLRPAGGIAISSPGW